MELTDRYRLAETFSQLIAAKTVKNAAVYPRWMGRGETFWYDHETKDGIEYRLVDAATGAVQPLFDHQQLAAALNEVAPEAAIDPADVPIDQLAVDDVGAVSFSAFARFWRFGTDGLTEVAVGPAPNLVVSPDGCSGVFMKDHNLWVRDMDSGEERALTGDGEEHFAYGARPDCNRVPHHQPEGMWSPDSRYLLTLQTDERQVLPLPMIDWAPEDGSVRPTASEVRTALPGDDHLTEFRMVAIDVQEGRVVAARHPRLAAVRMNDTPFSAGLTWWGSDGTAYFVDVQRGEREASVVAFDVRTGRCRVVFTETSDTYLDLGLNVYMPAAIVPLPATNELVWLSERTGWAHLYLYDLATGECTGAITQGEWLVRDILAVDEERREVWLAVAGTDADVDPYYRQVARVSLDGGEVTMVAEGDADHVVFQRGDFSLMLLQVEGKDVDAIAGVSPNGDHVVVTRSRADQVPVTRLLDRHGAEVAVIGEADISRLPPQWRWPESFTATAADGHTPIHGLLFSPIDPEPDHRHPVIDFIYGGPQATVVPKGSFNDLVGMNSYLEGMVFSALGFAVVMVDGRGTAFRDRAFHHASHGAIHEASHIDDHIAAIRQLAARRGDLDLDRVGIHGFSGGGYATAGAMLRRPEFFSVGVAGGGNYDQRLFWASWGERFHGLVDTVDYDVQHHLAHADGLRGKLLFVHGLQDTGCHPAALLQLVQALIDAQKDFDMLLQPRVAHAVNGYTSRRIWDYFITHLAGAQPPTGLRITNGSDLFVARMEQQQEALKALIAAASNTTNPL